MTYFIKRSYLTSAFPKVSQQVAKGHKLHDKKRRISSYTAGKHVHYVSVMPYIFHQTNLPQKLHLGIFISFLCKKTVCLNVLSIVSFFKSINCFTLTVSFKLMLLMLMLRLIQMRIIMAVRMAFTLLSTSISAITINVTAQYLTIR